MKLTGKLTKESKSLNAALSPRSGGGKVQDVVYNGESVVNEEGIATIPPYPAIPNIPVKNVLYNNKSVVDEHGDAIIPPYPSVNVKDVKVNGVSVVNNNGDANINQNLYSTSETVVGKWIDGRPIYQITFGTNKNTPLPASIDVSNLNIDFLIWSNGIGSDQNPMGNTVWSLNSVSASSNRLIYLNPKTTLKREGGFYVYFITLQYVKNEEV